MNDDLKRTEYLRSLRRGMVNHFDQDELEVLAFDASVDWDNLKGETKRTKTQALIMYLGRRGRLDDLVSLLREERPNVNWSIPPAANQQVKDEQAVSPHAYLIRDVRNRKPTAYTHRRRAGQLKRSWKNGIARRANGSKAISFRDGLSWGSIGQILGYLFGPKSAAEIDAIYDDLLTAYGGTDHGKPILSVNDLE